MSSDWIIYSKYSPKRKINVNSQEIAEKLSRCLRATSQFSKNHPNGLMSRWARIFIESRSQCYLYQLDSKQLKGKAHHAGSDGSKGKSDSSNLVNLLASV